MSTIVELLEEKRSELGESFKSFVGRFPGINNQQVYMSMRVGTRANIPSEWLPMIAELLGIEQSEIAQRFRTERGSARDSVREAVAYERSKEQKNSAWKQARDCEDANTRLRLVIALSAMLNPKEADSVIRDFRRPGGSDYLYPYSYQDHSFWVLAFMAGKRLGYINNDEGTPAAIRSAIENIARDYKDKVALAISGFAAGGYMYSEKEMPELHAICHFGL
jgi:hypothetical protein